MSWEYEGLFDALVDDQAEDIAGNYWKNIPTEILVGSMGYRTRTTKAGTRLEAEVYPIFGREKQGKLREARKNLTPERMQKQNINRSKRRLILLTEANFRADRDYHVTLTYDGEQPDVKRCMKDIRNFFEKIKRLRRQMKLPELKYIYSIGHDADERIHAHVIMSGGIDRTVLEKKWGHGIANTLMLQEYGNGLQGIANYLYKQNEKERLKGNRRFMKGWIPSQNLTRPKERTSDTRMTRRKVKQIAHDFRNEAKGVMEATYPGYAFQDCELYYSDIVDGVYIRCVMRKIE